MLIRSSAPKASQRRRYTLKADLVNNACERSHEHIGPQFSAIMWGCAGGVFAELGPYKFGRIEFWGTGWKLIHVHARIVRQKLFHLAATVDRMLINGWDA